MPYNPIPMSPIRTFTGGERVPQAPESGTGPGVVIHTAAALEAARAAKRSASSAPYSMAPTRWCSDGVWQAVPQQPYTPPVQDATLAPRRVIVEGQPLERPAAPLVDPRVQRQQALEQARRQNLADAARGTYQTAEGQWIPYPAAVRKEQQRLENQYAKGTMYCYEHGLAVWPTAEEWVRRDFVFTEAPAPPAVDAAG